MRALIWYLIVSMPIMLFVLGVLRLQAQDDVGERLVAIESQGRYTQETLQEVAGIVEDLRKEQVETARWRTGMEGKVDNLATWVIYIVYSLLGIAASILLAAAAFALKEWWKYLREKTGKDQHD